MRYVVTEGAGFIGSHLVEALAGAGHEVVIIDDFSSGKEENVQALVGAPGSRVTLVQATIEDFSGLLEHFEGTDGVFHQAALVSVPRSVEHPLASNEINLTGTLNVLVAARDTGVQKVVLASSAAVYGDLPGQPRTEGMPTDPLSPYAVAKLAGENYARVFSRLYGLSTVSLRYFNVYGPRQDPASHYAAVIPRFMHCLAHGRPPVIYGDGNQTRDFIYVKDVVAANLLAMEHGAGGTFNIGSGTATSINDLARTLIRLFSLPIEPVHAGAREGDVRESTADISRAEQVLKFKPAYGLLHGLEEMKEAASRAG